MSVFSSHSLRSSGIAALSAAFLLAPIGASGAVASDDFLPPCRPFQLQVSTFDPQAGVGNRQINYTLTNISPYECSVRNAPSLVEQSNFQPTTSTVGSTYFTANPPAIKIPLGTNQSAAGAVAWKVPDAPSQSPYTLILDFKDIDGPLDTGYQDDTGALSGSYVVTNLWPQQ